LFDWAEVQARVAILVDLAMDIKTAECTELGQYVKPIYKKMNTGASFNQWHKSYLPELNLNVAVWNVYLSTAQKPEFNFECKCD
jgi:hypothetical protein